MLGEKNKPLKDYTDEEINKILDEIENRPYQEYDNEALDFAYGDVLSEKELRKLQGRGPINKMLKFFSDIHEAWIINHQETYNPREKTFKDLEHLSRQIEEVENENESKGNK